MSVKLTIENCIDCPYHDIVPDPNLSDWFCHDDVAVLCRKTPGRPTDKFLYRPVTVACRPHHVRKESDVPSWCPLGDNPCEPAPIVVETSVYVHGDKDSMWEKAEELELHEDAARTFSGTAYELQLNIKVDRLTGKAELLSIECGDKKSELKSAIEI